MFKALLQMIGRVNILFQWIGDMRPEFEGIDFDFVPCQIDDLFVIIYQEDGIRVLSLEESPAYKYLIDGKAEDYINYHALIKRRYGLGTEQTLEHFQDLLAITKEKGWEDIDPLIVDYQFIIRDGQHRASIFKYLGCTNLFILKMKLSYTLSLRLREISFNG